jgi:hypothetical protein
MRGLRGRHALPPRHGILFPRCRSVHTFGMMQPISVVLLDRCGRVLVTRLVRPRRVVLPRRGTRHVLECAAHADLRPGDLLAILCRLPSGPLPLGPEPPPSSSGLGRRPFKAEARVRIPLGARHGHWIHRIAQTEYLRL